MHNSKAICSFLVILVFIIVLGLILGVVLNDHGLDIFVEPEKMDMVTRGYCRIQAEKTSHSATQPIPITCSAGFFQNLQAAQKTEAEEILIEIVADDYVALKPDIAQRIPLEDIDINSLVLSRKGIFEQITKDSLGFTFQANLTVKDNAPDVCAGEVTVRIRLVTYRQSPETGEMLALDAELPAYATFSYRIEDGMVYLNE